MLKTQDKKPLLITRTPIGQWADRSNQSNLAEGHQSSIGGAKGAWPEELPSVLWAYRTTTRTPIGETPFNLTYGTETVIPVEVGTTSIRREFFNEEANNE